MNAIAKQRPGGVIWDAILTAYIRIAVFTALSFTTTVLGTRWLADMGTDVANPFAEYAAVLPGQPRSAAIVLGFFCRSSDASTAEAEITETCVLWPSEGRFVLVTVFVNQALIHEVSFHVRGDRLSLGDLRLLWGVPQVVTRQANPDIYEWPEQGVRAWVADTRGRFTFSRTVRTVSILSVG